MGLKSSKPTKKEKTSSRQQQQVTSSDDKSLFDDEWANPILYPQWQPWLRADKFNNNCAFCLFCQTKISIKVKAVETIDRHLEDVEHQLNAENYKLRQLIRNGQDFSTCGLPVPTPSSSKAEPKAPVPAVFDLSRIPRCIRKRQFDGESDELEAKKLKEEQEQVVDGSGGVAVPEQ